MSVSRQPSTISQISVRRSASLAQRKKFTEYEIEELHHELETVDHVIPLKRLCQKLLTDPRLGLSHTTAERLLMRDGPNALSVPKVTPEYIKFLKCMYGGFAALLWICAAFCFLLYGIAYLMQDSAKGEGIEWLGIIIIIICLTSGCFAYHQESKNTKVMDSFNKMVPTVALVIRDGVRIEILADELVVGDLVEIRLGDRIPADIRIIESVGLRVENSSITGESEPLYRTNYPTDENPLESQNVAFFSSYAVAGEGKGIVIATGDKSMIGRLAGLTANLTKTKTPIAKEITHFVHIITGVALTSGFLFFFLSLIIDSSLMKAFSYLLGIIIANVPEVLLVSVTTSLTLTAQKMANKNCLVKNLEAVETLGSTSIICSDKTGTLTQNKMRVSNMWYANTRQHFPALETIGKEKDLLLESAAFRVFLKCATLCLRAEFKSDTASFSPAEKREVLGDASETGILKFCESIHPTKPFQLTHRKVAEIPFNSTTKYQLSIHKEEKGYTIIMKGAPEVIIDVCSSILNAEGETAEMTAKDVSAIKRACLELGYLGERVLGYADLFLEESKYGRGYRFDTTESKTYNFPKDNYRFVGLISLIDPPRPFVSDAVYKCRTAGIKVIMVTGDHPVTATSIAKKVGIISEGHETQYDRAMVPRASVSYNVDTADEAIVVTGTELRNMDASKLDEIIKNHEEIVFARTSPQQKLLIVESCQRLGEIVAVTGDGVNDSPALRKADIGVAMGIAGSDVTKSAADMILMDDNFASIVTGIEEGRLIFDNLKKSIAYTLTSSVPEMLPMLGSIILSIPLPLVIEMVLCIDIGTDMLPAIALVYEKSESDIMRRAPRNPNSDKLVNNRLISVTYGQIGMTQAMAGFCTYFCILLHHGFLPRDLFGLRSVWEDSSVEYVNDSWGNSWDYHNRMQLLNIARTGYFISIVITQMIDLIMCKTRKNSLFQQGMDNWFLNLSIVFEVLLTGILLYVPGTEDVLKTMPLDIIWYWPCLPFGISLWIYDEFRRLSIRKYPGCFFERETYY